jgi:hypothetical protein
MSDWLMAESTDSLLPLAILVIATLLGVIAAVVVLIRSGRVPGLAAGGRSPKDEPATRG